MCMNAGFMLPTIVKDHLIHGLANIESGIRFKDARSRQIRPNTGFR